jgi:hypothetical protein
MTYATQLKRGKSVEREHFPIYKIKGELYFLDKRLGEYRNIERPYESIKMENVSLSDLQKPTAKDGRKYLGVE